MLQRGKKDDMMERWSVMGRGLPHVGWQRKPRRRGVRVAVTWAKAMLGGGSSRSTALKVSCVPGPCWRSGIQGCTRMAMVLLLMKFTV